MECSDCHEANSRVLARSRQPSNCGTSRQLRGQSLARAELHPPLFRYLGAPTAFGSDAYLAIVPVFVRVVSRSSESAASFDPYPDRGRSETPVVSRSLWAVRRWHDHRGYRQIAPRAELTLNQALARRSGTN
jgi:hypothetical protein